MVPLGLVALAQNPSSPRKAGTLSKTNDIPTTVVLEERGLFWWHHEAIPPRQFAPDSCVPGLLRVDDDGRSTLELDGYLSSERGFVWMGAASDPELEKKQIQGLLKVSNQHILLTKLTSTGGRFSSAGISYEKYAAVYCLVGDEAPPAIKPPNFSEIVVDLDGLQGWLGLGSIESNRRKSSIRATYKKLKNIIYRTSAGEVSIKYDLSGPPMGYWKKSELILKDTARFCLKPDREFGVEEAAEKFGEIVDLFIMLTNSEYSLPNPKLLIKKGRRRQSFSLHTWTLKNDAKPPESYECATRFEQISNNFGNIVSEWHNKRDQFGPGFYLYLGVRRGMRFYAG
jgi:hypothetical protein